MADDALVRQVADRMRAAGWRGSDEERLLRKARRRVATAAYHHERADDYALLGARLRFTDDYRPGHLVACELEHRIREAACLEVIDRRVRDAALRMAPIWTQGLDKLLVIAEVVLEC